MFMTLRDQTASLPSLRDIQSRMNRLFDGTLDDGWSQEGQRTRTWAPPVEIYDTETELVFVVELPGFDQEDIEISVENGQLSFTGAREHTKQEDRNYHRNERWYGRFERTFQLPVSVDPEKIGASLKNGLLAIRVPKREEAKPRQIKVKVD